MSGERWSQFHAGYSAVASMQCSEYAWRLAGERLTSLQWGSRPWSTTIVPAGTTTGVRPSGGVGKGVSSSALPSTVLNIICARQFCLAFGYYARQDAKGQKFRDRTDPEKIQSYLGVFAPLRENPFLRVRIYRAKRVLSLTKGTRNSQRPHHRPVAITCASHGTSEANAISTSSLSACQISNDNFV